MGRLRTRKLVVLLCIAVVVCAAIVPTVASSLGAAILTALWLMPAASFVMIRRAAHGCGDQPASLLSLVLSRAPPATRALA
jgi:hypothetical protein